MDRLGVNIGDEASARAGEIIRVLVGSGVHGMAIEGTDDRDEMGVYIQPEREVLGLARSAGHWVARTAREGQRSGPDDTDLVMYGLRKFLRLATAGNPTVLIVLFADGEALLNLTDLGRELQALAPAIVGHNAGRRFLGYLDGQLERMDGGGRRSRVPYRPELIARHGYDTKYASHALRLGHQGIELLTTGRLHLPMPEPALPRCVAVKRGEVGRDEARAWIDEVRLALAAVVEGEPQALASQPDLDRVGDWMIPAQRRFWGIAHGGE